MGRAAGQHAARGRGRPAAATREAVLAAARSTFRARERVDAQAVAARLGISRATIYRWFGSRDGLVGEVLAAEFRRGFAQAERNIQSAGAAKILDTLVDTCSWLASSPELQTYLQAEQLTALRTITAANGRVQPEAVWAVHDLLDRVAAENGYMSSIPTPVLAFTLVRLVEAFLYTQYDETVALNTDLTHLRTVISALLGRSGR